MLIKILTFESNSPVDIERVARTIYGVPEARAAAEANDSTTAEVQG